MKYRVRCKLCTNPRRRKWANENTKKAGDSYIRRRIQFSRSTPLTAEGITSEIIELKRLQLQLFRAQKQVKNGNK